MAGSASFVVAGATGQVGSIVAEELLARGERVTIVARARERAARWPGRGAQVAVGDLGDARWLGETLRGAAGCFVLLPEDRRSSDFHGQRRRLADAVAAAVRESRVPHVAMISAIGAYLGENCGPIADLHHFENALGATGAVFSAIRSAYFQDNVAAMIPHARQSGVFPNFLPAAETPFATVASRDAGRVAAGVLVTPPDAGQVLDVIGPAYSVRQQADALGAALGRPLRVVDIPPADQVAALLHSGISPSVAGAYVEMFAAFASGRISPRGDRRIAVTTPLETTLREAIAALGAN